MNKYYWWKSISNFQGTYRQYECIRARHDIINCCAEGCRKLEKIGR